jgi:hypothetical protein
LNTKTLAQIGGKDIPPLTPVELELIKQELKAGNISKDIIVETVQGTPTRILSGQQVMQAMLQSAADLKINVKQLKVKLQEKTAYTPEEAAILKKQGEVGIQRAKANQDRLELLDKQRTQGIVWRLRNLLVDTSGNVKAKLLKDGGAAGEQAVRSFSLMSGATPRAHMMFQDFFKNVYGRRGPDDLPLGRDKQHVIADIKMSEVEMFNILAASRRTQAIVKAGGARASGTSGFKLGGAVEPDVAAGNVYVIRQALGDKRFAQLQTRVDDTFDIMHNQLVRLQEAGLIDMSSFLKMKNVDYITRQFVESMDPAMITSLRGKKVSIGESGIYHLDGGTKAAQNIDVQSLVAEYLVRTENRIFRNNANKALLQVAKTEPKNGFVMLKKGKGKKAAKPPQGYVDLKVMVDGKPVSMYMKDIYAAEWIINDPGMAMAISNMFRIVNGTFVVKPLATGMNPGFALVNFPRDIHHAWKATGDSYSKFLPMYLGQIANDLRAVAKDAWNKTGRYKDYIDEGGGMNFLTHGGFDPMSGFSAQKDALRAVGANQGKFGQNMRQMREVLSKVNEFSELTVRLAIRERVLKNQAKAGKPKNGEEATYIARDYLDFAQGGSVTKAMESFIPYTNAASQAIRTSLREYGKGRRAATTAAIKDLQVLTVKAGAAAWAWAENPETMAQVDPHAAYSSLIFPTGMSYTDEKGNRRHLTFKIAMDTTVLPLTSIFDMAIGKSKMIENGIDPSMVPDSHWIEHVTSMLPIISGLKTGSPTAQAIVALAANKDLWNNKDIWQGEEFVRPGARNDERTAGTIFETMGKLAPDTVSPVQLQTAVKTYVPSNTYIHTAQFITDMVENASDPEKAAIDAQRAQEDLTMEIIAGSPLFRRMVHITHPAAQTNEELRRAATEVQTFRALQNEQVRRALNHRKAFGGTERFEALMQEVAASRPEDAERVKDLFVLGIAVDEMYSNNQYDIGFVGKSWFNVLAGQTPEVRAELVYWKWVELSDKNAGNLLAVVESVSKVTGRNIRSPAFDSHFAKLVSQYGHRSERVRPDMSEQPGADSSIGATGGE